MLGADGSLNPLRDNIIINIIFFIYYSTINILISSTQVLLLLYNCPKAIICISYEGIDLIKLLIAFNDPP